MKNFILLVFIFFLPTFIFGQESNEKVCKVIVNSTNEMRISTPYNQSVNLYKDVNGDDISYHLSLRVVGRFRSIERTGVTITFEDGMQLTKPNERVDVDERKQQSIYDTYYLYSADVKLSETEVKLLSEKTIERIKLCNCEAEVDFKFAWEFKECVEVIMKIE